MRFWLWIFIVSVTSTPLIADPGRGIGAAAAGAQRGNSTNRPTASQHNEDQNDALGAVQRGRAEPLSDIIQSLDGQLGGRVIDARVFTQAGREIYDLTVIAAGGQVRHILVDAKTGRKL